MTNGAQYNAFAQQSSKTTAEKIGDEFFYCLKKNDFDSAAGLFHYSPAEKNKESKTIKKLLIFLTKEFGNIREYEFSRPVKFYQVYISGEEPKYWQKHPVSYTVYYKVNFSTEGEGYVSIDFSYIQEKIEIRAVHYGLPVSRSDGKERVVEIGKKMVKVFLEKNN